MKHTTELMPSRFKHVRSVRHAMDDIYGGDYGSPSALRRCEMPVFAVVGAVMGGMAIATGVVTGFAMVAAVGAVVAGVGVLVGSPELSTIGGLMGLAGGVGMLGTSQGWSGFAEMNTAFGGEAAAASSTVQTALAQPTAGMETVTGIDPISTSMTGADAGIMNTPVQTAAADQGVLQQAMGAPGTGEAATRMVGTPIQTVDQIAASAVGGNPLVPDVGKTGAGLMGYDTGALPPPTESSVWDKLSGLSEWADKHKVASEAIFKGLGAFGETFGDKYDAEVEGKKAMTDLYKERALTEAAQRENANYVPSVASQFAKTPGLSPFKTTTPTYVAPRMTGGIMSR